MAMKKAKPSYVTVAIDDRLAMMLEDFCEAHHGADPDTVVRKAIHSYIVRDLGQNSGAADITEGRAIQRYYRLRVEEIKRSAYLARISRPVAAIQNTPPKTETYTVAIANAPYFAASEVAGELCEVPGAQFGACYFEVSAGRWQYSLRSRGDFDVSQVALAFGGGGHKGAAGFTVDAPVHVRADCPLPRAPVHRL